MPTYTFENTKTGKVYDEYMSISDRETYLEQNPHIKQLINKINIVSGTGGIKNDSGWNDNLQRMKTLLMNNRESAVKDEPLEDAYLDVSNYGIMATIVNRGKWGT